MTMSQKEALTAVHELRRAYATSDVAGARYHDALCVVLNMAERSSEAEKELAEARAHGEGQHKMAMKWRAAADEARAAAERLQRVLDALAHAPAATHETVRAILAELDAHSVRGVNDALRGGRPGLTPTESTPGAEEPTRRWVCEACGTEHVVKVGDRLTVCGPCGGVQGKWHIYDDATPPPTDTDCPGLTTTPTEEHVRAVQEWRYRHRDDLKRRGSPLPLVGAILDAIDARARLTEQKGEKG